jgi:Domain of unknown function (DUF5069)
MNTAKLRELAKDLRKTPPRSPHEKLGGFVTAARSLEKCRAFLTDQNGEYNFHPCGLAAFLWEFTGVKPDAFKDFVATGASDEEVGHWLRSNSREKDPLAIIKWNNSLKDRRISELPDSYQEYFEEYIPKFCPRPNQIRFFFDVYDSEEGRL